MSKTTPPQFAGCDDLTVLMDEYEALGLLRLLDREFLDNLKKREAETRFQIPAEADLTQDGKEHFRLKELEAAQVRRQLLSDLRRRICQLRPEEAPTALCLSGGGIRSATFALGVLQGLARVRMLNTFHYLSTVSGGGYIGSWLSRWVKLQDGGLNAVAETLASEGQTEPEPIRRLRAYSNFLSPVAGLSVDFLTLLATFVRNLLLNWLVLVPALLAVLLLPRLHLSVIATSGVSAHLTAAVAAVAVGLVVLAVAYMASDLPGPTEKNATKQVENLFARYCFVPLIVAAILLSWVGAWGGALLQGSWSWMCVAVGAAVHALGAALGSWVWRRSRGVPSADQVKFTARGLSDGALVLVTGAAGGWLVYQAFRYSGTWAGDASWRQELYATLAVPILLGLFWLCTVAYAGLSRGVCSEDDREWWARAAAWWLGAIGAWIGAFVLIIYLPRWLLQLPWIDTHARTSLSVGAVLGIVTAGIGYWSKNGATLTHRAKGIVAVTGLRLLDFAALAAVLSLLLGLNYYISWRLSTFPGNESRITGYLTTRLNVYNYYAEAGREALACANASSHSSETALACRRAAEAAKKVADSAMVGTASSRARAACESAAKMDPTSEFDPDVNPNDVREQCRRAIDRAAQRTYEPTTGGWARLRYSATLHSPEWGQLVLWMACLFVVSLIAARLIGTNAFSLHSMYCNRLVRAYLGAPRPPPDSDDPNRRRPHWFTGFDCADNPPIGAASSDGATAVSETNARLFHVLNAALNLVRPAGHRLEWQQRRSESFTMSPLHCGGRRVGYVRSDSYSSDTGMSLGRAMAISGAAASPNMGYHTSSLVALVMTFFNVRLGWWMPNPSPWHQGVWARKEPQLKALPLFTEALGRTTDESEFVYLSDGGHFENLGLYEMVRRGCRRIVVVDAACDPKYEYSDLANAIRKIRTDLGVSIEFDALPSPELAAKTHRHFAVGRIRYGRADEECDDGELVYIKPVLSGDEPLDVERYAASGPKRHGRFPQQPTSDQFFDESQFESYRVLGLHSIVEGVRPFGKDGSWPDPLPGEARTGSVAVVQDDSGTKGPETRDKGGGGPASGKSGVVPNPLDAVQSLRPTALIASALAVGGLLGVTGTVAPHKDLRSS